MTLHIRGYHERAATPADPGTPIRFIASTEAIARDGLVIAADGSTIKRCRFCNEDRPIGWFLKDPNCKGGYSHKCRACRTAYARSYQLDKRIRRALDAVLVEAIRNSA